LQQLINHADELKRCAHILEQHLSQTKDAGVLAACAAAISDVQDSATKGAEEQKSFIPSKALLSHCRACNSEIAIVTGNAKVFNLDGSDHSATCGMKHIVCNAPAP
jgi:hypothetical protein